MALHHSTIDHGRTPDHRDGGRRSVRRQSVRPCGNRVNRGTYMRDPVVPYTADMFQCGWSPSKLPGKNMFF